MFERQQSIAKEWKHLQAYKMHNKQTCNCGNKNSQRDMFTT